MDCGFLEKIMNFRTNIRKVQHESAIPVFAKLPECAQE
jgi:hypothetical protein